VITLCGKLVHLVPFDSSIHLPLLLAWRNEASFLANCTHHRNKLSFEEFEAELHNDFRNDRYEQYLIFREGKFIGTIYSYDLKKTDGYIFVTTYVAIEARGTLACFEAFTLYLFHLFSSVPSLHKIYVEVYSYNTVSHKILIKAGFQEEGCFREHRLFGGQRHDLYRLAFYRNQLDSVRKQIERVMVQK